MTDIVLLADPRVADLPVGECGEPLADLRASPELLLDNRQADSAGAFALLRAGLVRRLLAAQTRLPAGVRLLIVEGYRPLALQQQYFGEYCAELRAAHPSWPDAQVRRQASGYISPPELAPHVAGAAVDLTLCDDDGRELPMGTPVNATPEDSDGGCYFAAPNVAAEARRNRDLLSAALSAEGLVNYPTEWWHWSYGDRYWAYATGAAAALYGPV